MLVFEELFLLWSVICTISRSITTASDTTTHLDEFEGFLEKYCKEEEVETDLLEKTSCFDIEISFERLEMSEVEEECDTHNE